VKVNGSVQPDILLFEHRFDGMAEMRFRENVTEVQDKTEDGKEAGISYNYDEYLLVMPDRDGLEKIVQDNTATWLAYAKQQEAEKQAQVIRDKRDKLLSDTDWTQTDDAPLSSEDKESVRKYRQALRDITAQSGFPQEIKWPDKPAVTKTENRSDRLDLTAQVTALQEQIAQM
jgi:hypothetical protein